MKNTTLVLLVMCSFAGFSVSGQEKPNKNAKYQIEVNGVCEQCKKRIEKAAYSVSGVKSAVWNIEDHTLNLIVNEQKCNVSQVKKAIAAVGHDTDEFKATDDAYDSLHSCCLYKRN